jgi:hypothetical protein
MPNRLSIQLCFFSNFTCEKFINCFTKRINPPFKMAFVNFSVTVGIKDITNGHWLVKKHESPKADYAGKVVRKIRFFKMG